MIRKYLREQGVISKIKGLAYSEFLVFLTNVTSPLNPNKYYICIHEDCKYKYKKMLASQLFTVLMLVSDSSLCECPHVYEETTLLSLV